MDNRQHIRRIFERFLLNRSSVEEVETLMNLLDSEDEHLLSDLVSEQLSKDEGLDEHIIGVERSLVLERNYQVIADKLLNAKKAAVKLKFRPALWMQIAALLVLTLTASMLFVHYRSQRGQELQYTVANGAENISPGGNKAVLTLSNGDQIQLDNNGEGKISEQQGILISRNSEGEIIYEVLKSEMSTQAGVNSVETPKGGQYKVKLSDGTWVQLNAGSKLSFPASFEGLSERQVELSGEGYFEVAHDRRRPFRVLTRTEGYFAGRKQLLEVLGTHFNLNAYDNEPVIKTTLIQGSVRVNDRILKPGQQSILAGAKLRVLAVDTALETAWKNQVFEFDNEDIRKVMRQLERWYDVEVDYNSLPDVHFNGTISRTAKLNEVIRMLRLSGNINLRVDGRVISARK